MADFYVDVLATSAAELNNITTRFREPSAKLIDGLMQDEKDDRTEIATKLSALLAFEIVPDCLHNARRFRTSVKGWAHGFIERHLIDVSRDFPSALFLIRRDYGPGSSCKAVVNRGEVVHVVYDQNYYKQATDWALLDIFRPFWHEHGLDMPYGTLWDEWLTSMAAKIEELNAENERKWLTLQFARGRESEDDQGDKAGPEPISFTFDDAFPEPPMRPAAPRHKIRRELVKNQVRTLCNICCTPVPIDSIDAQGLPVGIPDCYEITPCNVETSGRNHHTPIHVETWYRQPGKMVVCRRCWAMLSRKGGQKLRSRTGKRKGRNQ